MIRQQLRVREALAAGAPVLLAYRPAAGPAQALLLAAAATMTADTLRFMLLEGRGMISVPTATSRLAAQALPLQPGPGRVAYTVSVDAREGVSTGISVPDRLRTIRLLASTGALASDFVRPGHIFPVATDLDRPLALWQEPEQALGLVDLFGLGPAAVLCTALTDTGELATAEAWEARAAAAGIPSVSSADVQAWVRRVRPGVHSIGATPVATPYGPLVMCPFRGESGESYMAYHTPGLRPGALVSLRVVRACAAQDLLHALTCDCQARLCRLVRRTAANRSAVLIQLPARAGSPAPTPEEILIIGWMLKLLGVDRVLLKENTGPWNILSAVGLHVQQAAHRPPAARDRFLARP